MLNSQNCVKSNNGRSKSLSHYLDISGRRPLHNPQSGEEKRSNGSPGYTYSKEFKKHQKKCRHKRFLNVSPIKEKAVHCNCHDVSSRDGKRASPSGKKHSIKPSPSLIRGYHSSVSDWQVDVGAELPANSGDTQENHEDSLNTSDLEITSVFTPRSSNSSATSNAQRCSSTDQTVNTKTKTVKATTDSQEKLNKTDSTVKRSNYSAFISKFRFLCDEFKPESTVKPKEKPDEDDIIVVSQVGKNVRFSYWDIKRVVKNIISNVMLDNPSAIDNLTANQIAQRMKSLYHQDFSSRLKDINSCLQQAREKRVHSPSVLKEIRPGLRLADLESLNPEEWLNDVIINQYIGLLVNSKLSTSCCVSSFFYEELRRNVEKSTLPKNWHNKNYLLVPICLHSHWSLLCAFPQTQSLEVYNSMHMTDEEHECATLISTYLQFHYRRAMRVNCNWTISVCKDLPQQCNEYDCGVYVCMFARKILYKLSSNFTSDNVANFRFWLKEELIENKLKS